MSKRHLISLLALTTGMVSAQTLEGAKVTGLSGLVQVKVAKVWRALQLGEQLAENALVHLGQGAHLSLRYRSDGHREEAQGPGDLQVGNTEGNTMVVRYGFRNRQLELPRSGGLDAVGGSIANASHSKSTMRLRNPEGGSRDVNMESSAKGAPIAPAMLPAPIVSPAPPPEDSQLALAWDSQPSPSLISSSFGPFTVGGFRGEAVILDGENEVGRLPVKDNQPVNFSSLSLNEDTVYLVRLEDEGLLKGTLTFRLLSAEERQELNSLVLQTNVATEQRQQRLDRFSALGQYHLAAEEGKRWLEEQKEPSPYLLQVVYDLNRDLLRNSNQVEYWKDWSGTHKVPLEL